MLDVYRDNVHAHGHGYYSTLPLRFQLERRRGENLHTPTAALASRSAAGRTTPYLPLLRSGSREAFQVARAQMAGIIAERFRIECDAIPFGAEAFTLPGFCACCGCETMFQVSGMYSSRRLPDGRVFPNWREHLNCLSCGIVNRVRASLHVLQQVYAPRRNARIYVTERKTGTYDWMAQRYPNLQGSEYFEGGHTSGDIVNGVRHEDLQNMSFDDDTFEYVLTFDVMEHVPDHLKAIREIFRCLQPGGVLMITVPFSQNAEDHVVRAELRDDGTIEHFMTPEYHGNPVDMEKGSLCFRYFGWQLLKDLRDTGFIEAEVLNYWSKHLLHFGDPQFIITARKPAEDAAARAAL